MKRLRQGFLRVARGRAGIAAAALLLAAVALAGLGRLSRDGQTAIRMEPASSLASVTVAADGRVLQVRTSAATVEELLRRLSLDPGPDDLVSVDTAGPVQPEMAIQILRRTSTVVTEQHELAYRTVRREDRTLPIGETRELQAGQAGLLQVRTRLFYEDGREVASEPVGEQVLQPPVDRVVAYGSVGVVSRGGQEYRFVRELSMEATGYTAGKESNPDGNGYTYTGIRAVRGVVAVDPSVIPLHTRLFIEGYGPAIAADIGGAIKGMKIDLCFDTVAEALQWGRRPVTVYVLSD